MTDILNSSLRLADEVVESAVGDEIVLLHLVNGTYYGLDPVGTRIWGMIKDGTPAPDICQQLAADYQVDLATIEGDARIFLADLKEQGILVDG